MATAGVLPPDEHGACTASFVDLTCPGRTLLAGPGNSYLAYAGELPAGTVVTVTHLGNFRGANIPDVTVAGTASSTPIDLSAYLKPGDTVRIQVRVSSGGATTNATAIEYALIYA
jgi:hypothetical protein